MAKRGYKISNNGGSGEFLITAATHKNDGFPTSIKIHELIEQKKSHEISLADNKKIIIAASRIMKKHKNAFDNLAK